MVTYSKFRKLIGIAIALLSILGFIPQATANTDRMLFGFTTSYDTYPLVTESISIQEITSPEMQIRAISVARLSYLKLNKELRIRGWKVRDNVYFGHTKVANKWGLGVLIVHRGFALGINNRGLQILKRF
jgi:hypothetical protein